VTGKVITIPYIYNKTNYLLKLKDDLQFITET